MIISGGIYRFSNEHFAGVLRVFTLDNKLVFYDDWDEESETWLSINNKSIMYRQMPLSLMERHSTLLEKSNFTNGELSKIRPDLPLNIGVNENLSWYVSKMEFLNLVSKLECDAYFEIERLCFFTLRKNGNIIKKPHYLSSGNGQLSVREILTFAYSLQQENPKLKFEGIGIFRCGYNNEVPSYYIGGCDRYANPS
ncbi:MAG: hypothetical protein ACI9N1_002168 [Flavobacteriales bacterium]|jgi:hypothetical protein